MEGLLTYLTQGISNGLIYGIVALGFVLIYKSSHILNFAVGEFLLVGAYIAWAVNSGIASVWPTGPMWAVTIAVFVCVIIAASVMGLVIERVAIRPLIGQPILGIILMTLAISAILRSVVLLIWGPVAKSFDPRLFPAEAIQINDLVLRPGHIWILAAIILVLAAFFFFFKITRTGIEKRNVGRFAIGTGGLGRTLSKRPWIIAALVAVTGCIIGASFMNGDQSLGDLRIRQENLWGLIVALVLLAGFSYFFRFSRSGLAMRATSEDHQLARGTGIRVKVVFAQSWAICAVVAALAGVIIGSMTNITLDLSAIGLRSVAVVLVGGLESVPGAIVAGLLIGVAEGLAVGYINPLVGGGVEVVFAFAIAIISLLIWPYGLFGLRRIERI